MRLFLLILISALVAAAGFCLPASAQNISGVSGADVHAGAARFEYRAGFSPETGDDPFAQRFQFHYAPDERWRFRAVLFQNNRDGNGLRTRDVSLDIMRQFLESEKTGGWDSAIRIDGRISVAVNRPGRMRAAWINNFDLGRGWAARANIYVGKEIGDAAGDGLTVETREEITYALSGKFKLGAQLLNNFNTTATIGGFRSQRHQLGPVLKGRLSERIKFETSALFGVSEAASDADLRLFVSYGF